MYVDVMFVFKIVISSLLLILLVLGIYLAVEGIRIVINIRRITDRMEMMSDVRSWLTLFRGFSRSRRRSGNDAQ